MNLKGKLIIIEAGDGSGKATQTARLQERLAAAGQPARRVEYPNYASPSSALIKMYLNGEFGSDPQAVNPYAASAFYAVDRYASYKKEWADFYEKGGIVIADRYTTSNMVHQAAKIADPREKDNFLNWLWDFEFVKCGLPVPDCVIFLNMPPEYARRLIDKRSAASGGSGQQDIHERNSQYLTDCYQNALLAAEKYQWRQVDCVAGQELKTIEEIHEEVFRIVRQVIF